MCSTQTQHTQVIFRSHSVECCVLVELRWISLMTHKGEIVHLSRAYEGNQSNKNPILRQYKKKCLVKSKFSSANLTMTLVLWARNENKFPMSKKSVVSIRCESVFWHLHNVMFVSMNTLNT